MKPRSSNSSGQAIQNPFPTAISARVHGSDKGATSATNRCAAQSRHSPGGDRR